MICYRQIQIHNKPIVFINLFGFWDRFFDMMFELRQQKMISEPLNSYYEVVNDSEQAMEYLMGEFS
ncbi:MAG: LOG family protein [Bdellovibrionales bacterium]